jgi:hypothetical protein
MKQAIAEKTSIVIRSTSYMLPNCFFCLILLFCFLGDYRHLNFPGIQKIRLFLALTIGECHLLGSWSNSTGAKVFRTLAKK